MSGCSAPGGVPWEADPPDPSRGSPCWLHAHAPELPERIESGPSLRRPVRSEHCGRSPSTRMISSFWADRMRPSRRPNREPPWGWEALPPRSLRFCHRQSQAGNTQQDTQTEPLSPRVTRNDKSRDSRACGRGCLRQQVVPGDPCVMLTQVARRCGVNVAFF